MNLNRSKKRSEKHITAGRYHRRRQNHTLAQEDCEGIVRLMEHGFSLADSLEILDEKRNHPMFVSIKEKMKNGESISEYFSEFTPKVLRGYFDGFIRYMPFVESLSSSIAIVKNEKKNREEIVRGMLYPVLLMIGMCAGIWLFSKMILPNMVNLLEGFNMETDNYLLMQEVISRISEVLFIGVIVSLASAFYALSKTHIVKTYQFVSRYFPNSILVQYASCQFARFYLECERRNVSTFETMKILIQVKEKPLVSYIAKEMDMHLLNGESMSYAFEKSHVEHALLRFFKIALYSSQCEVMLEGYLDMVHFRTSHLIRKFSRYIQLISYSCVGCVLVFVYRILMMPMRMLQTI